MMGRLSVWWTLIFAVYAFGASLIAEEADGNAVPLLSRPENSLLTVLLADNVTELKTMIANEGCALKLFSQAMSYCQQKYGINSTYTTPLHIAVLMRAPATLRYLLFDLHLQDLRDQQEKFARDYADSKEISQVFEEYDRFCWWNPLIICAFRVAQAFKP